MNPEVLRKVKAEAEAEVAQIVEAWPTAKIRWTLDGCAAVALIQGETFTYVIEVDGDITRSLWVSHRHPIVEGYVPDWTDGWVD